MDNWYTESAFHNYYRSGFKIKQKLHEETSNYQKIVVYDTYAVGKLLTLDGKTMVSELDEFVYHEIMAHVPYMVHQAVKKVAIIGGGDGGVVREFVKHKDITQIDLIEIDKRVVEVSREFFPECTIGLDDPRVTIHATDGIEFIKNCKNTYDIIVVDSTDPENFATGLFTESFYQSVASALTDKGIMMAQLENPFLDEFNMKSIFSSIKKSFPIAQALTAPMIIYPGVIWTFGFASKYYKATEIVESKIKKMDKMKETLKWYNMNWHCGAFQLSNFHRKNLGVDELH